MKRRRDAHTRRMLRLLGGFSLIAGVAALGGGVAYSYFTSTGAGSGTAQVGTLALSVNAPATNSCTYNALTPGDLTGSATCALSVTYQGGISAYVSLTIDVRSQAGSGGHTLYDPAGGSGLTFAIADENGTTYDVPTGTGTTGGSCPTGYTCWTAPYDLAAPPSTGTPSPGFSDGDQATFTVTPYFLTTAGNSYQGASAVLTLTAQAVQAPGNTLPNSCTIGQPCLGGGSFSWS